MGKINAKKLEEAAKKVKAAKRKAGGALPVCYIWCCHVSYHRHAVTSS